MEKEKCFSRPFKYMDIDYELLVICHADGLVFGLTYELSAGADLLHSRADGTFTTILDLAKDIRKNVIAYGEGQSLYEYLGTCVNSVMDYWRDGDPDLSFEG